MKVSAVAAAVLLLAFIHGSAATESSDGGEIHTWTTVVDVHPRRLSSDTVSSTTSMDCTEAATNLYRITFTASHSGGSVCLNELELEDSGGNKLSASYVDGSATHCCKCTEEETMTCDHSNPYSLFDGDVTTDSTSSWWCAGAANLPASLDFTIESTQQLARYYTTQNRGGDDYAPRDWTLMQKHTCIVVL